MLASTTTLTLLLLASPGITQAATADVAGVAKTSIAAVPSAATTAASAARSIASSTTAHVAAAAPAAQPVANAVTTAETVAQKVTSGSSVGGSSSGANAAPSAVHAGSTAQPGSSESLAGTIVRHVETQVSAAIPHNVRPDAPVSSRVKAIVADPDPHAHGGAPVVVVAASRGGGHHAHGGSRRTRPHASVAHASASRAPGGKRLVGPATPGALLAAALEQARSVSLAATGDRPGAVVPVADAIRPPGGAAHASAVRVHPRGSPRAGRVDIAGTLDLSAPGTAAVAPGGSEGSASGVGAGTSAAAAAILGLAGLWLLRALLPGLLTLDIFPWQSTLRAMRLERPG